MEQLIIEVKRPERKGADSVIRVNGNAMEILAYLQSRTGHSISHLASKMIEYANNHCLIVDNID